MNTDETKEDIDPLLLAQTLETTVPEDDFSPEAVKKRVKELETVFDITADTENLEDESHVSISRPALEPETLMPDRSSSRYEITGLIGKGGTGKVFSARDRALEREVAIKILHEKYSVETKRNRRFLHEARITASLEHPNILPIHDLDASPDGGLYVTMRQAKGISLGETIRKAAEGEVPRQVETANDCINIILKICDALAYAHEKGIIHQDIKPDNVILGEFGEVMLVDWGTASSSAEDAGMGKKKLVGTPAYMSPEQARKESADKRSDIYCIGSTFFHLMFRRHPVWADTPEEFWEKKKKGVLDPLNSEEVSRVDPRLTAIIMKCLKSDPDQRYQRVKELTGDLLKFQEGQAVSVFRDSLFDILKRWYRRNTKVFWISVSAACLVVLAGLLYIREKQKELSSWQPVELSGSLDTDPENWVDSNWGIYTFHNWNFSMPYAKTADELEFISFEPGMIRSEIPRAQGVVNLYLEKPLPGDIAMEWDYTPEKEVWNLNSIIGGDRRTTAYTFHINAGGSMGHFMLTKGTGTGMKWLDAKHMDTEFSKGQTYRFRIEKEGEYIRLFIDGEPIFVHRDGDFLFGPGHQTLGFDLCWNSLTISNVKIFRKPLPEKISPLAVPNSLAEQGLYEQAAMRYHELQDAYPGTDLAARSVYRIALLAIKKDEYREALKYLNTVEAEFPDHALIPDVLQVKADLLFRLEDYAGVETALGVLETRLPDSSYVRMAQMTLDSQIAGFFGVEDNSWSEPGIYEKVMRWYHFWKKWTSHDSKFAGKRGAGTRMIAILQKSGHHEDVMDYFPDNKYECKKAVSYMFGDEEAERRYPQSPEYKQALELVASGEYETLLKELPDQRKVLIDYLLKNNGFDKLKMLFPVNSAEWERKRLESAGRYEELLNDPDVKGADRWSLLNRLGRYKQVVAEYPENGERGWWILEESQLMLGMEDEIREKGHMTQYVYPLSFVRTGFRYLKNGETEKAFEWFAKMENSPVCYSSSYDYYIISRFFMFPILLKESKGKKWFESKLAEYRDSYKNRFGRRVEKAVDFITGKSDELPLEKNNLFIKAIRAEFGGDLKKAAEYYEKSKDEFGNYSTKAAFTELLDWKIKHLQK